MPYFPRYCARALSRSVLFVVFCSGLASAYTPKVVHNFVPLANGAHPQASLISDSAGNLYGTTTDGGAHGFGEVFELIAHSNGKFATKVLYSFAGGVIDGANPVAALTLDPSGDLYGTTQHGGPIEAGVCPAGCGTVFKLTLGMNGTWVQSETFFFDNGSGGAEPTTGVTLDSSGNLYGTTINGGTAQNGVVYRLTPSNSTWTETLLYVFAGFNDGGGPSSVPIFDQAGNLYGAASGGVTGYGLVYRLSPSSSGWTKTVIHDFSGCFIDGSQPDALIFDKAGNLYGTTGQVCGNNKGTVFELIPQSGGAWLERLLYIFGMNSTDGTIPRGSIALDAAGSLYGSTVAGGTKNVGVVYQLTQQATGLWIEHIIHNFTPAAGGASPFGGVVFDTSGDLYAVGYAGGSTACPLTTVYGYTIPGCGTVIRMIPAASGPWVYTVISDFASTDGASPQGGLLRDRAGSYYGTTSQGGLFGWGEVFRLTKGKDNSWTKTTLHEFTGASGDGIYPSGDLVEDQAGNLYGTTQAGGYGYQCSSVYAGCGIVYELMPSSSGYWTEKILYSFQFWVDGGGPITGLALDGNGNLYGTTLQGAQGACPIGSSGCGTVFRLSPAPGGAWTETTLYQFTGGDDGGNPFSVVLDSSGNLYGTTAYGGSATVGTAFELSSDSGGNYTFSLLHAFGSSSQDISYPTSGLVVDKARNLYGTASLAGTQGYGAVYEISPSTTALWNISTIHSFTGKPDGSEPFSGVTVDSAGSIYGATAYGGRAAICPAPYPTGYLGCGTIFKLTPGSNGWTETVIYSFTGRGDGAFPFSSVSVDGAGNILTTTSAGGGGNQGTVLELIP